MNRDRSIVTCHNGKDQFSAHRICAGHGETEERAIEDLKRKERMAADRAAKEAEAEQGEQ